MTQSAARNFAVRYIIMASVLVGIATMPSVVSAVRSDGVHSDRSEQGRDYDEALRRAREAMSLWRYDEAAGWLRRAVTAVPNDPTAHAMLGDAAFVQDDFAAAVGEYETAARLDPNDVSLQDRVSMARAYRAADAALDRVYTAHFVVKYRPGDRAVAERVGDALEDVSRFVDRTLGYEAHSSWTVILHPPETFEQLTGSPPWARGLFDGRLHFAVEAFRSVPSNWGGALTHEYAHAVVHRLTHGHAPTWLSEGLALYLEGRSATPLTTGERDRLAPLHALHGPFLGLDRADASLAYAESVSAVQMLVADYGWTRMRRLLIGLAETPEFPEVFQSAMGDPYRDFQARWTRVEQSRGAGN